MIKIIGFSLFVVAFHFSSSVKSFGQAVIINDVKKKILRFGNHTMQFILDYDKKLNISQLAIKGQKVVDGPNGIYSLIKTKDKTYSTLNLPEDPVIQIAHNRITMTGIQLGTREVPIQERWEFTIDSNDIKISLTRTLAKSVVAEKIGVPVFTFSQIDTWEGAFQDYGGLAWFYLFKRKLDTYGVHSKSSDFWNSRTGNGLSISVMAREKQIALDYSRTTTDEITCGVSISKNDIIPRFDSGTNRRRYVRDTTAVWAPVTIEKGETSYEISMSYFNVEEKYSRGRMVGLNQDQVNGVLNTIARIGVIDKYLFGGNSWHTPYGPICLHEQYIAQMGVAINDSNYLRGYKESLNFYRDNAIKSDGRVRARWAYSDEDAMPGETTSEGFYEAQWGYLLDANPDYVTNVAELYEQTGDKPWVKSQQLACEKALDWIIKRDSDGDGLAEMITDSHKQKRGSDWIDIIWAAYENAFVNAKLFYALVLWADVENELGNSEKASYYNRFAQKLKTSFNRSTEDGGFWSSAKQCYIHWREKDGSAHGTNLVTPVNFMAIAYGICEDSARSRIILENIESQMQKENLFFWPLCMYSYADGEGNDWQFPFPNYENGDIFLSWGSVAVKAYAKYKPEIAVKYIRNVLGQYEKDGLAFQRYGRKNGQGLGDDILSGNSLAIVGLFQSIFGISPLHNRFYLDPHITPDLSGTELKYRYRGKILTVGLQTSKYSVSDGRFKVVSPGAFGFFASNNKLSYFDKDSRTPSLTASTSVRIQMDILNWEPQQKVWREHSEAKLHDGSGVSYLLNDLKKNSYYSVQIGDKPKTKMKTNAEGILRFDSTPRHHSCTISVSEY